MAEEHRPQPGQSARDERADSPAQRSSAVPAPLIGMLAIVAYGFLGYQAYRALVPAVEVSLSAAYEPYSRWLTVRGGAYAHAAPVDDGNALVVFETSDPNATHSFHVPVKQGHFQLDVEIAAAADRPGVLRRVTATVEAGRFGGSGVGRVLGPNEIDGRILRIVMVVWAVLLGVFVWLFTGEYSWSKQRFAIVYSYVVAALFLIVPLAVPVVVAVVPGVGARLAQTPVGFLQVATATTGNDGKTINIGQWSLNIGGSPVESVSVLSEPVKQVAPSPVAVPDVASASQPSAAPAVNAPGAPAADSVDAAGASQGLGPFVHSALGALKSAVPTAPAKTTITRIELASPARSVSPERVDDLARIYDVKGGLVVPLYVLILATIGGAFRMTRTVPEIEWDTRSLEARRVARKSLTVRDVVALPLRAALAPFEALQAGRMPTATEPAPRDSVALHIQALDAMLEAMPAPPATQAIAAAASGDQAQPDTVTPTSAQAEPAQKLSRATLEEELAEARKSLAHQVLFLFTSPFMGILAYYALVFVHDDFGTKTPIVAIVAFVSGIKSEDVLQKIVDLAQAAAQANSKA